MCKEVSIPKAVSTAATAMVIGSLSLNVMGFNTVNGRYCCNYRVGENCFCISIVSIP